LINKDWSIKVSMILVSKTIGGKYSAPTPGFGLFLFLWVVGSQLEMVSTGKQT